jgi:hypothetical protein
MQLPVTAAPAQQTPFRDPHSVTLVQEHLNRFNLQSAAAKTATLLAGVCVCVCDVLLACVCVCVMCCAPEPGLLCRW